MASLPYMQLYVADYLADTFHLTTEEHGAYLLMLFNYWQTGKPLKCERIPSLIRVTKERFKEMEFVLSEFFIIEDGFWIHKRIQEDLDNALNKSVKASESAKKRWAKKVVNANALQTQCHKNRVDKKREDEIIIKDNTPSNGLSSELKNQAYSVEFENLWKWYRENTSNPVGDKKNAFKKFNISIKTFGKDVVAKGVGVYVQNCKNNNQFTKHLSTLLNEDLNEYATTDIKEPVVYNQKGSRRDMINKALQMQENMNQGVVNE